MIYGKEFEVTQSTQGGNCGNQYTPAKIGKPKQTPYNQKAQGIFTPTEITTWLAVK